MSELLSSTSLSGFKRHGIKRVSASAINSYVASPSAWFVERVKGLSVPVGVAALRGTASEDGIVFGLKDLEAPVSACVDAALTTFDRLAALRGDPKREKERAAIPGIVEQGLIALRPYGTPSGFQVPVEHQIPGCSVPLIGFCDAVWDQHQIILDIKSTLRVSSDITAAHRRQIACYVHNTNYQGRIGYIGPTKHAVYALEDAALAWDEVCSIVKRMEAFLSLSDDQDFLASLLVPDYDHYFWSNPMARLNGKAVYGW